MPNKHYISRSQRKSKGFKGILIGAVIIFVIAAIIVIMSVTKLSEKSTDTAYESDPFLHGISLTPIGTDDSLEEGEKIDEALHLVWQSFGINEKRIRTRKLGNVEGLIDVELKRYTVPVSDKFPLTLVNYRIHQFLSLIGAEVLDASMDEWGKTLEVSVGFSGFTTHVIQLKKEPDLEPSRVNVAIIIDDPSKKPDGILDQFIDSGIKINYVLNPAKIKGQGVYEKIKENKEEMVVCIPMEPENFPHDDPGNDAIFANLPEAEIRNRVRNHTSAFPEAKFACRYLGSKIVCNEKLMEVIYNELCKQGVTFLNTGTIPVEHCEQISVENGVPFLKTGLYINTPNSSVSSIESSILSAALYARIQQEPVIWELCFSESVLQALDNIGGILKDWGINFVNLSEFMQGVTQGPEE
ncbi:divergent polysaccharide deacetylase family protein [bacterium]|nr:divergent polysaccharide deacetylase family protein [bacterium]